MTQEYNLFKQVILISYINEISDAKVLQVDVRLFFMQYICCVS